MTQASRPSSTDPCKRRNVAGNASAIASEWAAKRQAKIEAAQAKKQAKENGEVTDQHTFHPQVGRAPAPGRRERVSRLSSSDSVCSSQHPLAEVSNSTRVAKKASQPAVRARSTGKTGIAKSCAHERVTVAPPWPQRERIDSSQSYESLKIAAAAVELGVHSAVSSASGVSGELWNFYTQRGLDVNLDRKEVGLDGSDETGKPAFEASESKAPSFNGDAGIFKTQEVQESAPATAASCLESTGKEPRPGHRVIEPSGDTWDFYMREQNIGAATVEATASSRNGFSVMLASSETLSLASSHSIRSCSASSFQGQNGVAKSCLRERGSVAPPWLDVPRDSSSQSVASWSSVVHRDCEPVEIAGAAVERGVHSVSPRASEVTHPWQEISPSKTEISLDGSEETVRPGSEVSECKAPQPIGDPEGDDLWLRSGMLAPSSDTTATTRSGFSVMLASSETLSLASSHSLRGDSASSFQDMLLASTSQHLPLGDNSDLMECQAGDPEGDDLWLRSGMLPPSCDTTMTTRSDFSVSGISWDGIAFEVEHQHQLSRSSSSSSPCRAACTTQTRAAETERCAHERGRSLHGEGGRPLGMQLREWPSKRQESVLEGVRRAEKVADANGCVSMQELQACFLGTTHEDVLQSLERSGVVELTLCEWENALKDFHLSSHYHQDSHQELRMTAASSGASSAPVPARSSESTGSVRRHRSSGSLCNIASRPGALPTLAPVRSLSGMPSDEAVTVPWREAPLRREEVVPDFIAHQPMRREHCIPSPQALQRDIESMPSALNASAELFPLRADVPQEEVASSQETVEENRRHWRRARVASLERKCQELEQQLGVAKQAELALRNEMLTGIPIEIEPSPRSAPFIEALEPGDRLRQAQSATGYGRTRLEGDSSSSIAHAHTAPTVAKADVGSKRPLLSPVAEDPFREEIDASSGEPSPEPQIHVECQPEATPAAADEEGSSEMMKLVQMWFRLSREGVAVPEEEKDRLHDLLGRLSALMESRSLEEPASQSHGQAARDAATTDMITKTAPVPRLLGPPFYNTASPGWHEEINKVTAETANIEHVVDAEMTRTPPVEDTLPAPRDTPWGSKDGRVPSPRDVPFSIDTWPHHPRDTPCVPARNGWLRPRNVTSPATIDATSCSPREPLASPRDPPASPRDVRPFSQRDVTPHSPRDAMLPSPEHVPLLR